MLINSFGLIKVFNYLFLFFLFVYKRGPGHQLLEHPDKDGNLPLMHACAKLDIGLVIRFLSL